MIFFVVGGIFEDTSWQSVPNHEIHGPFTSYDEAHAVWASEMWRNVDNCLHRLFILDVT